MKTDVLVCGGGAADGSARVLAQAMAPALGQAIAVENKAGAGNQHDHLALAAQRFALRRASRLVATLATLPQVRSFKSLGLTDFGLASEPSNSAALRDTIRSEIARWGEVIGSRGIKLK